MLLCISMFPHQASETTPLCMSSLNTAGRSSRNFFIFGSPDTRFTCIVRKQGGLDPVHCLRR